MAADHWLDCCSIAVYYFIRSICARNQGAFLFYRKFLRMIVRICPARQQHYEKRRSFMDTRIALIGIVLDSTKSVDELNRLLSEYGSYIIGRMGIPYREKNLSIISIAMDAPADAISALSGKLGMLPGVSTKTIYAKNK